jgi:hypothetical protein
MVCSVVQGHAVVGCHCGNRHVSRGVLPCWHLTHGPVSAHAQLQPGPTAVKVVRAGQPLFLAVPPAVSSWEAHSCSGCLGMTQMD